MAELPEAEPGWQRALAEEPEARSVAVPWVLLRSSAAAREAEQLDSSAQNVAALAALLQLEPAAAQPV